MDRQKLEEAKLLIKEIDELNGIKDFVGEGRQRNRYGHL